MFSPFHLPIFFVNFKSYVWGRKALKLAQIIEKVAQETSVYTCVIPQTVDIPLLAKETTLPVFAPHMDPLTPGPGTGHVLPEAIREAGAVGVLMNHAENRRSLPEIATSIKRARDVGLISIVGAETPEEVGTVATFKPDMVLPESPSRIGTLKSIGRDKDFVIQSIQHVKHVDPTIVIICGAGVSSGPDITELIRLGVEGTGASRAIMETTEPQRLLSEMINALQLEWNKQRRR